MTPIRFTDVIKELDKKYSFKPDFDFNKDYNEAHKLIFLIDNIKYKCLCYINKRYEEIRYKEIRYEGEKIVLLFYHDDISENTLNNINVYYDIWNNPNIYLKLKIIKDGIRTEINNTSQKTTLDNIIRNIIYRISCFFTLKHKIQDDAEKNNLLLYRLLSGEKIENLSIYNKFDYKYNNLDDKKEKINKIQNIKNKTIINFLNICQLYNNINIKKINDEKTELKEINDKIIKILNIAYKIDENNLEEKINENNLEEKNDHKLSKILYSLDLDIKKLAKFDNKLEKEKQENLSIDKIKKDLEKYLDNEFRNYLIYNYKLNQYDKYELILNYLEKFYIEYKYDFVNVSFDDQKILDKINAENIYQKYIQYLLLHNSEIRDIFEVYHYLRSTLMETTRICPH
jgi:hypothetical protein